MYRCFVWYENIGVPASPMKEVKGGWKLGDLLWELWWGDNPTTGATGPTAWHRGHLEEMAEIQMSQDEPKAAKENEKSPHILYNIS